MITININIKDTKLELTIEEAIQLKTELDLILGKTICIPYAPYTEPYVLPKVTC